MTSRSHKILMLLNRTVSEDPSNKNNTEWHESSKESTKHYEDKENIPTETGKITEIIQPSTSITEANIMTTRTSSRSSSTSYSSSSTNSSSNHSNRSSRCPPVTTVKSGVFLQNFEPNERKEPQTNIMTTRTSSRSSSTSSSSSSTNSSSNHSNRSSRCPPVTTVKSGIFLQNFEPNERKEPHKESSETSRQQSTSPSLITLQNVEPTITHRGPVVNYQVSPIHSGESDVDLSDNDPTYNAEKLGRQRSLSTSSSATDATLNITSANSTITSVTNDDTAARKITRKRKADPTKWKQNIQKIKRNLGQEYFSVNSKKIIGPREMKPPCSQKCRLKCNEKLNEDKRKEHFKSFWALGDLHVQRMFILSCMTTVTPKYKYSNAERPREPNNAYYFTEGNEKIRVCKTFFINTLGVTQKMIRTIRTKAQNGNYLVEDKRGRHKNHKSVDEVLKNDIIAFNNSIPRIESHYLRASTSREYISGGKTIADLFRDFEELQKSKDLDAGRFHTFYEVFTTQFNIGFFQPKKDQCDLCLQYHNSTSSQKCALQEKYDAHLEEKNLSREEKMKVRQNVNDCNLCVCFDVQAIMQSPNGDTSSFYYKSKLNSYNFTLTELNKLKDNESGEDCKSYGDVHCYFWDETQGKRGAIEIGSCVFNYLQRVAEKSRDKEINVTFISDNCCGQNKNKYMAALFMYAVSNIKNLKKITHNFLIKGHTQNEADNVHSLIQKQIAKDLKSGPIYTPLQYITAIQRARKSGKPFIIHSLTYDFFFDVKEMQNKWGYNFNVNERKDNVLWNDIKVMMFTKEKPFSFYYKLSYKDDFKEINVRNKRKRMLEHSDILIQKAYNKPFELSSSKKNDLRELVFKKLIDPYHAIYFNNMLQ